MKDPIERQAAIEATENADVAVLYHKDEPVDEAIEEAIFATKRSVITSIRDLPSAQQWIPCSEKLPENGRQVLVYARSVHFALAKYDEMREADGKYKKQWVTFDAWKPFYTIKEVIAWMPLQEPYEVGRHE